MSRSHHASDCRSGTIGATVSYTGSVFCSVSMSTNRRVHTLLHLICIQCRTNSLFCISERPLGRGDTSIFNLTRCISTGILSYTASLYNTSTPHRNLYVGITELIVAHNHLTVLTAFCSLYSLTPRFHRCYYQTSNGVLSRSESISFFATHSICKII